MTVNFQNYNDRAYDAYYRFYGLNLSYVRDLQTLFDKKVDMQNGQHLTIQQEQAQILNNPNNQSTWLTPESYFVDWSMSSSIQNLQLLEQILQQSLQDLTGQDNPLVHNRYYQDSPREAQFVTRVLTRKMHEMQEITPDADYKTLCRKAIEALEKALEEDKKNRNNDPGARLTQFTHFEEAESILNKKCIKTVSWQVGLAAAVVLLINFKKLI